MFTRNSSAGQKLKTSHSTASYSYRIRSLKAQSPLNDLTCCRFNNSNNNNNNNNKRLEDFDKREHRKGAPKIAPSLGGPGAPIMHCSLDPAASTAQTTPRSVQQFCTAHGCVHTHTFTDAHVDHATSVAIGRISAHAMRRNNNKQI